MSSFLHKGKRALKKQQQKNTAEVMNTFQLTLESMNKVYHLLMNDTEVTQGNLKEKVKQYSDFNFSDKQIEMLETDVLTNKGLLTTTDEQQTQDQS